MASRSLALLFFFSLLGVEVTNGRTLVLTVEFGSIFSYQLDSIFFACQDAWVTYEPATLACLDGYAVAYLQHDEDEPVKIKGTFRAKSSVTAVMIAAEGQIVYDGLVDDGETLKHTVVSVTVRSFGKVAAFESCRQPVVFEDIRKGSQA